MHDAAWNHESLTRLQINRLVLQIDNEVTVKHKEELVFVVVFMPVILALHYP